MTNAVHGESMEHNISWGEATFRGLLGFVLVIIAMDLVIIQPWQDGLVAALIVAAFAVVMIATAAMGFCPLYRAFGRKAIEQSPFDHA